MFIFNKTGQSFNGYKTKEDGVTKIRGTKD